ncbi:MULTISPECIES: HdeA/HdeB family chaperone [unclassified Paracoccus (in: a-proteobacteria)]|uniref:HdeA/HdeB family chaperone n=1 Tax=unclassified Paracoccus (in: a-proteobacteria) TaxID=2688777 RepID=UPI0016034FEE|nr:MULTISPECIES: HdeA/HdeB family chaperone [unclassified Paracoccus (in: a-proteobacteria)]MBB1492509.1 hypothetical protein [Paracoccus sp. MC1854]MBB1499387.1 hypothetical protein [Paracoccus sp. MC1862]QQO43954.1 hypothetical protein JGR78_11055 [Paracoccus sp. MC1862]
MRFPFPAIAAACIAAAPSFGQDAAPEVVARLESMTCREFLALDAEGQATVRAAMQAHASGEPLPDAPLPDPAASAEGAAGVVEDRTGADRTEAPAEPAAPGGGTGAPEVVAGENESGKVAPDGTEASVTDEGGDRRLIAMRTSCEGGPDALALNALRAAFGNNL